MLTYPSKVIKMMANSNPSLKQFANPSGVMNAVVEPEVEGVALDDLAVGSVIEAETWHNTYRIENRGDGKILISGHPQYCPERVLVDLHGSTSGEGILKFHFIGRGMHLEFRHPTLGVVRTSRIKEVREAAKKAS
jgi:hypothetical protein